MAFRLGDKDLEHMGWKQKTPYHDLGQLDEVDQIGEFTGKMRTLDAQSQGTGDLHFNTNARMAHEQAVRAFLNDRGLSADAERLMGRSKKKDLSKTIEEYKDPKNHVAANKNKSILYAAALAALGSGVFFGAKKLRAGIALKAKTGENMKILNPKLYEQIYKSATGKPVPVNNPMRYKNYNSIELFLDELKNPKGWPKK